MHSLATVVASCLLAGDVALAASGKNQTFSLTAKRAPNSQRNPIVDMALTYAKYSIPQPAGLSTLLNSLAGVQTLSLAGVDNSTSDDGQRGSVVTSPIAYDALYLTEVEIGTPPQKLLLDFDTGSSDLWVFSNELNKTQAGNHALYSPDKSSSAEKIEGASWSIGYLDKSTSSGDVYRDVVRIGGLTVDEQAVEAAKSVSTSFAGQGANFSGLVGLAFDGLNTVTPEKQKTWLSNIMEDLDEPLFTTNFKKDADGSYNFGYIDQRQYQGGITYTPLLSFRGVWEFISPGWAIGDDSFTIQFIESIADTGTSVLYMPDAVAKAYWARVPGAVKIQDAIWVFPCGAKLPDFSYAVDATRMTIPGSFFDFAPVDGSPACVGGMQSSSLGNIAIFGDVALKAAFVVWDAGNSRLGFAKQS